MSGERYVVELEFKRIGDLGIEAAAAKIRKAESGVTSFKKGWNELRSSVSPVGSAIDSVAAATGRLAARGAMIGGAALVGGITYGVVGLNNELEKATISLGTIFSANGMAANVPEGMQTASGLIKQMRVDAQKLPGEFEDLMNIFTTGAIPAFHSGASIGQFKELSAKVMAAGKVASMDLHQVAREFAMLMEGRSGAHNVLGMKLLGLSGDSAAAFNKKSGSDRLEILSKELNKYAGAIDQFGSSFDAQSSTLVDNFKNVGRMTTAPVFESVKRTLSEANGWFDQNQSRVEAWADSAGQSIDKAFNTGKDIILEYGPLLQEFARTSKEEFDALWVDAKPLVQEIGVLFKEALKDPDNLIGSMKDLAKLYITFKATQAAGGVALDIAQGVGGVAQMVMAAKSLGLIGGAANAAGAAGAAAKTGLAAKAGGLASGALPYMLGALPPALVAGSLWYGAFGGVKTKEDHSSDAQREGKQLANQTFERLNEKGTHVTEMMEAVRGEAAFMRARFMDVTAAAYELQFAMRAAALSNPYESVEEKMRREATERNSAFLAGPLRPPQFDAKKATNAIKHKGGGGGSVQKIEIVVTSNQHPSRIARAVVGEIHKHARLSGSSVHTANFSALEENY